MILVMIGVATLAEKRQEFTQTVDSLLDQIRISPGCLGCYLYQNPDDANALCIFARWCSQAEFEDYTGTDTFAILRGAMRLLLKKPPEIKIFTVTEILESVRLPDKLKH